MARYYDAANTFVEYFNEPGVATIIYCKLFSDMVTDTVCILRREYPDSRKGFSCNGCIMNIALDRRSC